MSDVLPVVREWVGGKDVVVQETRHERGKELHRDMEWGPNVELRESRTYYALVDGLIAMQIVGGLGYDGENNLIEVILFVRKLSVIVPDTWQMPARDVVGDVVRFLVSALAEEHMGAMHGNMSYMAHMEAPLRERGYLHWAVRTWSPEVDIRAVTRRW
ncbi:hypothetical protein CBR_g37396 [Chara braunii]|uniref:Uncharacterized protein n=1 Tax=Chara braunii TaxID=69332 RepID=A0A388JZR9_CHABU|nr:hypothetical protein CBR_g37396 [Chara braunii]|eukprot:GBG63310.1 hypothetical protein CBR_g37396 [Chara braunii]